VFEAGKTCKTRDGREVRIYATDGEWPYKIHAALRGPCGWMSCIYTEDGRRYTACKNESDLVKPLKELWAVYHADGSLASVSFQTEEDAKKWADCPGMENVRIVKFQEVKDE
jgi:hypothetical protein